MMTGYHDCRIKEKGFSVYRKIVITTDPVTLLEPSSGLFSWEVNGIVRGDKGVTIKGNSRQLRR